MSEKIEIKLATVADVPVILSLTKELAEYVKMLPEMEATAESLKEALFGHKPQAEVILSYLNDIPVGFAVFFSNFSTFLGRSNIYIEDMFVKPEARGKGIGKKMLSYLARLAKERKCTRLEWRVLNWNENAIAFYQHLGAKPLSQWHVYRIADKSLDELAVS